MCQRLPIPGPGCGGWQQLVVIERRAFWVLLILMSMNLTVLMICFQTSRDASSLDARLMWWFVDVVDDY